MEHDETGRHRIRGVHRPVQVAGEQLRKPLTEAQAVLWQALRGRQLASRAMNASMTTNCRLVAIVTPSPKLGRRGRGMRASSSKGDRIG